jgi:hypothetical protein
MVDNPMAASQQLPDFTDRFKYHRACFTVCVYAPKGTDPAGFAWQHVPDSKFICRDDPEGAYAMAIRVGMRWLHKQSNAKDLELRTQHVILYD